jgi:upstream activation factor subunit UAF30
MSRTVAPSKPRTAGALAKPLTPSPELAAVVGVEPLARTAVVSKLWDYIKAHDLQDPADKRGIIADDTLRPIFGADRVTMFELAKVIGPHLTAA